MVRGHQAEAAERNDVRREEEACLGAVAVIHYCPAGRTFLDLRIEDVHMRIAIDALADDTRGISPMHGSVAQEQQNHWSLRLYAWGF